MSPLTILYRLIIYPLELFFETVFYLSEKHVHNPALSILILSLVVNFLVLPLYRRADAMQEQEREMGAKMAPWLKHIRKTFKGDERFMMTQTYYRQMGYKQVYVLRSSVPLLLQIPFFIAAYHFLSHLNYLSGVKLGPIKDLAEPDALIAIGGITLNLLPILMTAINAASATVYSKGFPIKTKIQMYGIAAIFLVLLYNSPAGLVFYWTLNNLFSLGKNIVAALMKKRGIAAKPEEVIKPAISDKGDNAIWFIGALILTVMTGVLIPAGTVSIAPQDFIMLTHYISPMWLIMYSFLTAAGIFIVWFGVFYLLAGSKGRRIMALISFVMAMAALIDCFFVKRNDAGITITLVYKADYHVGDDGAMINVVALTSAVILIYYLQKYQKKLMPFIALVPLIAISVMSIRYLITANDELSDKYYLDDRYITKVDLTLSTEGHNVVVIMLDRAIGDYVPFIMENDPELKAQFDGFTYYSDVLSYGSNTLFGAPALYGGPEYSVQNLNLRSDEKMEDKVNEALMVMPVLFEENGYEVTVTDPPYAGYHWIPDVSIYDGYDINAAVIQGAYTDRFASYDDNAEAILDRQERNFFCYGLSKIVPVYMHDLIYDDGNYNAIEYGSGDRILGDTWAHGFMDSYGVLASLSDMTVTVNDSSDHFLMMTNNTTHEDVLISANDYGGGLTYEDRYLPIDNGARVRFMQVNEAALKALGRWFDTLREEGVYDNTRIIIVSDHGFYMEQEEDLLIGGDLDLMSYFPLLMIKDFDTEGFTIDNGFTMNAIVPYMATEGLFEGGAANPFTGNVFDTEFLNEEPVIIASENSNPQDNPGTKFADAVWYILHGDSIWNMTAEEIPAP